MVVLSKERLIHDSTYKAEAGIVAEYLVDNHIIGSDPANPVEIGESLGNPTREPVPCKTPGEDVEEIPVSANTPSIGRVGIGGFVIVERIH